jgi:transcription elongation GreA/GreB family factor
VVVRDQQGGEQSWRIVSSHDAAPREGLLSAESPVAVALLGRTPGEEISVSLPKGKRTLTVISVS